MVTITTAIMGLVNACLQLVVAFGVNISDAQNAAITTFVNALLIVGALVWDYAHKNPVPPKTASTG